MTRQHSRFLYRCLDAEGGLLYVGITCDTDKRLAEHRRSWWGYLIAFTPQVEFPSRDEAREAEIEAITTESPRFNRQGRWADRSGWTEQNYRDFYDATRFAPFSGHRARRLEMTRAECHNRYGVDIAPMKENIA